MGRRRSTHRRASHRHSTHHRATHHTRTSRAGKPHPHRGAHVPHPGARHPRVESPAQRAAAARSLVAARAAEHAKHPAGQQTPAQLAAERASLIKARAARKAKAHGRTARRRTTIRRRVRAVTHPRKRATTRRHTTHRHTVRHPAVKRVRSAAAHHAATTRRVTGHHVAGHTGHTGVTRSRPAAAHRSHPFGVRPRHIAGLRGPRHHYNRRGLAKSTHWLSGHRARIHPRHVRWSWTVRAGRRHGWDWTKPRKARQQW